MLNKAYIPYAGYFSSPFCRWQGSLANEHPIKLAGKTSKAWLSSKGIDPTSFDYLILGMTIGQPAWFYAGPWAAALAGISGFEDRPSASAAMTISQACTTSATCVFQAGMGVETGLYDQVWTLLTDRCSNGPHTVWPNPNGPGGEVISENWLMDNFNRDPWAGQPMIQTAENVAQEEGFSKEACDDLALRRYEQYQQSLENDRAFQKRYMTSLEVQVSKKKTLQISEDEGIFPTTKDGLAGLKALLPNGAHSFGSQTHPADGNAGLVVTTREKAREYSTDPAREIQILSYGFSRAKKGYMAKAPVAAAQMALDKAGVSMDSIATLKTHNPFAVNDLFLARQFDIDAMGFNNFGSPLVFGHPQGPTVARCLIEGIEETVQNGGGYFLFSGCAAGDTGGALLLKIG